MKGKFWYIKERFNRQLNNGNPIYYAQGNISMARAKKIEDSLYGRNVMLKFDTEAAYKTKCEELGITAK